MNNETAIEVTPSNKPVKMVSAKKRKNTQELQLKDHQIASAANLSDEATLAILQMGLSKEIENRSQEETLAIQAQSQFTIDAILKVQQVNRALDDQHNQKIDELNEVQRKAAANIDAMLTQAIEGQRLWAQQLNTLSPEAAKVMAEFLGSDDPKE